jgi:glutamate N-acetyltransferase/amino-acid N-acetyltransferase
VNIYKKAILPLGFKASGFASGIKKSGKLDLALFYSDIPAKASAMFTSNKIQAAPVVLCKDHLKKNKIFKAIIANSGNANCFTGKTGSVNAQTTARILAKTLRTNLKSILVCSTGIIGKQLPMDKIINGIPVLAAGLSKHGIAQAEKAIMTTDKFVKEITVKFPIRQTTVTVCGIAKGAGMIAPNMATMLAFIFTDANITQKALDKALKMSVSDSFNCITVDGCMSTNDSAIVMANGAGENKAIDEKNNFEPFVKALGIVCLKLARMMVADGEGATKFIEIKVKGALSQAEAKKAALAIANSNLFKTAMYGENPNFGRIVASVGASGINCKEKDLKIKLSDLKKKDIKIEVALGRGKSECTVYTSDLSPEYIKINAAYN